MPVVPAERLDVGQLLIPAVAENFTPHNVKGATGVFVRDASSAGNNPRDYISSSASGGNPETAVGGGSFRQREKTGGGDQCICIHGISPKKELRDCCPVVVNYNHWILNVNSTSEIFFDA
jgi:hypothetical protein